MNDPRRLWSLILGVAYMAMAVLIGFDIGEVWSAFAPDGAAARSHPLLTVLTTILPHVVVIAGLALLIAGRRLGRRSFVAVALVPFAYIAICLIIRAQY